MTPNVLTETSSYIDTCTCILSAVSLLPLSQHKLVWKKYRCNSYHAKFVISLQIVKVGLNGQSSNNSYCCFVPGNGGSWM